MHHTHSIKQLSEDVTLKTDS